MGMFDDIAAEHERTKNTPAPSYAESCRAKWEALGAAELAKHYAEFCRRERIPTVRIDAGQKSGPGWVIHLTYEGYTMQYVAVLGDGGLLPVSKPTLKYGVSWTPAHGYVFTGWESPSSDDAASLEADFRKAASLALEARDRRAPR